MKEITMDEITRIKVIQCMDESELVEFLFEFYDNAVRGELEFENESDVERWIEGNASVGDDVIARVATHMFDSGVI